MRKIGGVGQPFVVFGEAVEACGPGEAALQHPPSGQEHESAFGRGQLDHLQLETLRGRRFNRPRGACQRSGVAFKRSSPMLNCASLRMWSLRNGARVADSRQVAGGPGLESHTRSACAKSAHHTISRWCRRSRPCLRGRVQQIRARERIDAIYAQQECGRSTAAHY
jgi:hypothetical protein